LTWKKYTREQLIKKYVDRCREKGKMIKQLELIRDKKLPAYGTYYNYDIRMNELYKAAGYDKKIYCTYTRKQLIGDYIKECEKAGRLLDKEDIKDNCNLAIYITYENRGLNIAKLKKEADGKSYNKLDEFCKECAEKDNCQYNYNLEKCEYYKEAEINV